MSSGSRKDRSINSEWKGVTKERSLYKTVDIDVFANALLLSTRKMWGFYLQKEKEKKKEEKKRESEKTSKQLAVEKVRIRFFPSYLRITHSIRHVQRLEKK